jgi:hypothetical protein
MLQDQPHVELRARVFISCGQRKDSEEEKLARKIETRLINLGFEPYVAVGEQSLSGLKENLFRQLDRSEYFVFIDFKRECLDGTDCYRGSLFSHQELAIASYLEIEPLAFQEQGVKQNDGVLGFIQGNAIPFSEREKLPDLVIEHVERRMKDGKWDPRWRNDLVLERSPAECRDIMHAGLEKKHRYFHIDVHNRHRRKIAMNCCAYLEKAISLDSRNEISFKMFELKWEGYLLPGAHILAGKTRSFDAFCIECDVPAKLEFYGSYDASYFLPRIEGSGRYELTYSVVADNFPAARKSFYLTLSSSLNATTLAAG